MSKTTLPKKTYGQQISPQKDGLAEKEASHPDQPEPSPGAECAGPMETPSSPS